MFREELGGLRVFLENTKPNSVSYERVQSITTLVGGTFHPLTKGKLTHELCSIQKLIGNGEFPCRYPPIVTAPSLSEVGALIGKLTVCHCP
jgi:hypothetical protein